MKRERAKELREVFNAFCDGKDIQFREDFENSWKIILNGEGSGFLEGYEYRIKPEPEVIYVNKWGDKHNQKNCHSSEAEAIQKARISGLEYIYIAKPFTERE